jgi:hypothetical protein
MYAIEYPGSRFGLGLTIPLIFRIFLSVEKEEITDT